MTMSLTYLDDLSRVRIEFSSITPDGAFHVQKAALTADPPWSTVRGATRLPVTSGTAQVDDYEFYADVENWYRALRVDPHPGLQLTGSGGDYASTPDAAALDITGDIMLWCYGALDDWTSGAIQALVSKWDETADERSYRLIVTATGELGIEWSTDGTAGTLESENTTNPIDVDDGDLIALMVTLDVDDGSGNHVVTFWRAATDDLQWTQIEALTLSGTTSIHSGTADLEIGSSEGGTIDLAAGQVHSAAVVDGINGTNAADPDFAAEADGTTNFADDAGNTWTVNGSAEILGELVEAAQSITPDLEGVTWIKSIKYPALNRPIGEAPEYRPIQNSSRTGVFNTKGRVPPVAVYDSWTSRWWTMEFVTNTLAEARDMELVLTASRTLFIHVPVESANECFTNPVSGMPGGYVMAQNATMRHTVGGSHVMQWVLPIRVVAPPKPEIAGTTVTWKTLQRLYGSWEALWASNATWRDVWGLIGDPEDFANLG